ncbi:ABC transporter permease [soil metagenome]
MPWPGTRARGWSNEGMATGMNDRRTFLRLVALVARRDYLRTVRRRGFVLGTALLPLGIAGFLLLSSVVMPALEPQPGVGAPLTLVNQSTLRLQVPPDARISVRPLDEVRSLLSTGGLREFYVIPSGYPEQPEVQRVVGPSRGPGIEDLQRRSQQEQLLARLLVASLLADTEVPTSTAARLLDPYRLRDTSGDGAGPVPGFQAAGFLVPYAFTFLFVMSIFITSGYLLQSVTEEKENRVVEILLSSVPSLPLMAGKILGLGAAGLTQVAVWVGAALAALPLMAERVPGLGGIAISPVTLALALAFFILGYLCYGAIFAAIGALAPGTREAQQYSGFFGFFAVVPLIFAGLFIADSQSPLVTALALIPLTAPAAMLQLLALLSEPPWLLVAASLISLAAFAALATLAAARVFRATLLLYGARPSVRRIVDAITARG